MNTKEEASEKEEQETRRKKRTRLEIVKIRCVNPVSMEAFVFLPGEDSESCGILGVIFGMNLVVCLTVIL